MDVGSKLDVYLSRQRPLFEALTQLLHPFMEIAIHCPEGTIVEIFHNLTKRRVGELGSTRDLCVDEGRFFMRRNGERHPLKCASLPIREGGDLIGVVALHVDTQMFQEALQLFQSFVSLPEGGEIETEDCRSKVGQIVADFLRRKNRSLSHLSRLEKREAVHLLHEKGIFAFKNSVPEVAGQLHLSRATVYNYLKEI